MRHKIPWIFSLTPTLLINSKLLINSTRIRSQILLSIFEKGTIYLLLPNSLHNLFFCFFLVYFYFVHISREFRNEACYQAYLTTVWRTHQKHLNSLTRRCKIWNTIYAHYITLQSLYICTWLYVVRKSCNPVSISMIINDRSAALENRDVLSD